MEAEPPMPDFSVSSVEAERRRETSQVRDRERRQSMSTEQQENYLARWRQSYQMQRERYASTGTHEGLQRTVGTNPNIDTNVGCINERDNMSHDGVYDFRAHGTIYHKIGTLLPVSRTRPRYIQMFIYDTKHETENRLLENNSLDRELVDKIKRILDAHNLFFQTLRQLAQRDDILDSNNVHYPKFKQAAEKRGLLEEDDSIRQCLIEARAIRMPSALRRLFATIMLYCQPTGIVEDYQDLSSMSGLIEDELTIPISLDDLNAVSKVNPGQLHAFSIIKNVIMRNQSAAFFIDGPGGTGKTFLCRVLLASFRNVGFIMVATATSDRATTILWDEAPMADKKAIETVDRTLRELFGVDFLFGGKIMILGGDFRQVVPVVVGGTRSQAVKTSIVESYLWSNIKVLHLTDNIRANNNQSFSEFLLNIGNGEEPIMENNMIRIPDSMAIPFEGDHSIDRLIEYTFPNIGSHTYDPEYMMDRALITPLNDDVNKLYERVLQASLVRKKLHIVHLILYPRT
ncbi:hypothetical protein Sango_0796700 [Sesamum angolense]|uniref:ATP-dependent DNA helicase n=1 Tax=Sesamum angolense TaxID=2727404 RepID=A0AAE1X364_9LAMI|nr:hypothetical protein Sango_0796700 [Sesamum angolense]